MSAWQPIETAPQDADAEIAVLEPGGGGAWIVRWSSHLGWKIKAVPGRDPVITIYPTHWMPLPSLRVDSE